MVLIEYVFLSNGRLFLHYILLKYRKLKHSNYKQSNIDIIIVVGVVFLLFSIVIFMYRRVERDLGRFFVGDYPSKIYSNVYVNHH